MRQHARVTTAVTLFVTLVFFTANSLAADSMTNGRSAAGTCAHYKALSFECGWACMTNATWIAESKEAALELCKCMYFNGGTVKEFQTFNLLIPFNEATNVSLSIAPPKEREVVAGSWDLNFVAWVSNSLITSIGPLKLPSKATTVYVDCARYSFSVVDIDFAKNGPVTHSLAPFVSICEGLFAAAVASPVLRKASSQS